MPQSNYYDPVDPEHSAAEYEVRSHTMDAVRACEFYGMPALAAAEELERLADALREDGSYEDVLGGELDVADAETWVGVTFDEQDRRTFERAIETWGIDAQADMAEEEAAEFLVASKHYKRSKIDADELIDELADVRIMAEQLALFLGEDAVERCVNEKMDRLREQLEGDMNE